MAGIRDEHVMCHVAAPWLSVHVLDLVADIPGRWSTNPLGAGTPICSRFKSSQSHTRERAIPAGRFSPPTHKRLVICPSHPVAGAPLLCCRAARSPRARPARSRDRATRPGSVGAGSTEHWRSVSAVLSSDNGPSSPLVGASWRSDSWAQGCAYTPHSVCT